MLMTSIKTYRGQMELAHKKWKPDIPKRKKCKKVNLGENIKQT